MRKHYKIARNVSAAPRPPFAAQRWEVWRACRGGRPHACLHPFGVTRGRAKARWGSDQTRGRTEMDFWQEMLSGGSSSTSSRTRRAGHPALAGEGAGAGGAPEEGYGDVSRLNSNSFPRQHPCRGLFQRARRRDGWGGTLLGWHVGPRRGRLPAPPPAWPSALLSPELFTFHDFHLHEGSALFLHTPRSLRSETRLSYKQSPGQAVSPEVPL